MKENTSLENSNMKSQRHKIKIIQVESFENEKKNIRSGRVGKKEKDLFSSESKCLLGVRNHTRKVSNEETNSEKFFRVMML